ncbi:MAG TPA: hypothetical protein GX528_07425 [Firmicutes bacterium]|nr:hypothetical protein [Bacillota bacterium]
MTQSAAYALSLRLLGPFRLEVYGNVVPDKNWKSKKALLILKYLAARYQEKIPSDVLIDMFWQDADFETASRNLHGTVHLLRKTLREYTPNGFIKPPWIQFGNGLYWLEAQENVFLDLQRFATSSKKSELLEEKKPRQALAACLAALELYRGSFLAEDLYLEWAGEIREYYHKQYLEIVLRTSKLLLDYEFNPKKAASICESALKHEPYLEELHQMLIRSYISMERFPNAILHFNAYAKALSEEFGLEPSAKTKILLQEIKDPHFRERIKPTTAKICEREIFEATLSRFAATKQPLTLLAIAFDDSKQARKYTGEILSLLTKSLRKDDLATQWSPLLFVVFLSDSDKKCALLIQERIYTALGTNLKNCCRIYSHVFSTEGAKKISDLIKEMTEKGIAR